MDIPSDETLKRMCENGYKKALSRYINQHELDVNRYKRWIEEAEDDLKRYKSSLVSIERYLLEDRATMKRIEELGL